MTENRTTELLRLLEERGIEWKDGDAAYEIEWSTPDGRRCSAMYWKPTFTVLISGCTPEQAVAATLGSMEAKQLLLRAFGLAQMMHDCWIEECEAGDNVDISACNAYSYEFDQVAQAMFDMGIDPNDSDYYKSATLWSDANPDGLPVGLTISEDGDLLNWRGENYVKQATLGSGECEKTCYCVLEDEQDVCSECGELWEYVQSFCPSCGRKAVKQ